MQENGEIPRDLSQLSNQEMNDLQNDLDEKRKISELNYESLHGDLDDINPENNIPDPMEGLLSWEEENELHNEHENFGVHNSDSDILSMDNATELFQMNLDEDSADYMRNSKFMRRFQEQIQQGLIDQNILRVQQQWLNSDLSAMIAVHLDFKHGIYPITYLNDLLPEIRQFGANAIMLEFEENFAWQNEFRSHKKFNNQQLKENNPELIASKQFENFEEGEETGYTQMEIKEILKIAEAAKLQVIPYINLCGDLHFLIERNLNFHHVQTNDQDTLNPAIQASIDFSMHIVHQILKISPKTNWMHIGCKMPEHLGWSMAEKAWMHERKQGIGELFLNFLSQVLSKINESHPYLKTIIWANDLMNISPNSIVKSGINKKTYPMFVSNTRAHSIDIDPEDIASLGSLFPAIFSASSYKAELRHNIEENLSSVRFYANSVLNWVDRENGVWTQLINEYNVPVLGMALMGPNRMDHYSSLTEPLPAAMFSLATCIQTILEGEYSDHTKWQIEEQLQIDTLPQKFYPRPMPEIRGKFTGNSVFYSLQKFENRKVEASRLLNDDKVRDFTTLYHIKHCKIYKPILGEIRMRALAQIRRLDAELIDLETEMLSIGRSHYVLEWLQQNGSPVRLQLQNLMDRIDYLWKCSEKSSD